MSRLIIQKLMALVLFVGCLLIDMPEAFSAEFKQDVHYTKFENGIAKKDQGVVEYFSLSCPGCYAFESKITKLIESNPSITFERIHTPFGGKNARLSQKVFVLMQLLDAKHQINDVFSRIHVSKKNFRSDDDVLDYFVEMGFDRAKVENTMISFAADSQLRKMNKKVSRNKVFNVPTIIVNDQYVVNLKAIRTETQLHRLIQYLSDR